MKRKQKKKTKSSKATTQDVDYGGAPSNNNNIIVGAQFISIVQQQQPRIAEDRQEKSNPSNSKKRRKFNNNNHNANNNKNKGTSSNKNIEEEEDENNKSSILCVTTPHRVVFMENDKTGSSSLSAEAAAAVSTPALLYEDNYMESKSRNYITKPGISTSFSPLNSTTFSFFGPPSSTLFSGGVLGKGVQYDPASNLIYGIRGGGTNGDNTSNEIVIWSAVPVSTLPGPDDDEIIGVDDNNMNGMNGSSNKNVTPKKRKGHSSQQHQHQHHQTTTPFWGDDIIKERLQLPKDKVAVSLSPFYVLLDNDRHVASSSSSSTKKKKRGKAGGGGGGSGVKTCAIGAIGCCTDGSIYVVSRFFHQHKPLNDDKFQLRIVEDTGLLNNNKKDVSSSSWKVLDSHISMAVGNTTNDGKSSIILSIQSVTMSSDTKIKVSVQNNQVRIDNNMKGGGRDVTIHLEKSTEQSVLELESCDYDIATKLDSAHLSIVHRNNTKKREEEDDDKSNDWVFTSANLLSKSNDTAGSLNISKTIATCPLPNSDIMEGGTIFSFGKLGKNIIALLMKSSKSSNGSSSIMSLRIIDFQRKAELSTYSWVEGGGDDEPSPTMKTVDAALNNMLHDKVCHGMVTNESDGSIALLTSSPTTTGGSSSSSLLDIVYSKLDIMSTELTSKDDEPSIVVASKSNSLASALRFVATSSASHPIEKSEFTVSKKGSQAFNLASMISSDATMLSHQAAVDEAVDKACQTLTSSAQELIDSTLNNEGEKTSMTNGKSKKGPKSGKKSSVRTVASWKEVYQNSCTLIAKTKEGGKTNCGKKNLVNGIIDKGRGGLDHAGIAKVTKRFIDTAFKETATILLSLHKADASIKAQKTFQKVVQEATCILIEVLETNVISARADYGIPLLNRGNALLSILHACPSSTEADKCDDVGKLHVINAMLEHVRDIHESALVSILRLLLRKVSVDDAVAFYTTSSTSKKGTILSNQYRAMSGSADETKRKGIETKLLSEAMLDLSSKIVTYSNCNHFFLTKAMRDCINTNGEVGTLLMTLTRLLKLSSKGTYPRENDKHSSNYTNSHRVTLSTGTIYWISALTDAHMGTILKIKNEGGVAIDQMQRSIRSTMAQSKLASDVRESLDLITSPKPKAIKLAPKPSIVAQQSKKEEDEAMPLYNMERLAF